MCPQINLPGVASFPTSVWWKPCPEPGGLQGWREVEWVGRRVLASGILAQRARPLRPSGRLAVEQARLARWRAGAEEFETAPFKSAAALAHVNCVCEFEF